MDLNGGFLLLFLLKLAHLFRKRGCPVTQVRTYTVSLLCVGVLACYACLVILFIYNTGTLRECF